MSEIIIGRNAILEAFDAETEIEKVFVLNSLRGEFESNIRRLCKDCNIPLAKVPEQKLNELSKNKNHQGVVAIMASISYVNHENLIAKVYENGAIPLFMILDSVTDVRNIGAIARSAHYFGAHGIIITGNFKGRINEDTIKASAGAIIKIPVSRVNSSIFTLISELQTKGIQVVAAALHREALPPNQCRMDIPTAIILGSEEKGVQPKVLQVVDHIVQIPAATDFDSLNVSVAGGILLYEAYHQRSKK
jgi:23S rRNA (guanosine2251-2'-O)-methyltransferase